MGDFFNKNKPVLMTVTVVVVLFFIAIQGVEPRIWVGTLLSGLTLAALFFLIAAGLSLIFGLMDVLNFAHGTLFMLGAYLGWTFFSNPRLVLNLVPLVLALAAGVMMAGVFPLKIPKWAYWLAGLIALGVIIYAMSGLDIAALAAFSPTTVGGAVSTAEAQDPAPILLGRVGLLFVAGLALSPIFASNEGKHTTQLPLLKARLLKSGWKIVALLALAVLIVYTRLNTELLLLGQPFDLALGSLQIKEFQLSVDMRFLLAMVVGALGGAFLGALIESTLIRPLYERTISQVMLTLGLAFIGLELVRLIWGPAGYPPLDRPSLFAARCASDSLGQWLVEHCNSIKILERPFPSYRFFIIGVGMLMAIVIGVLLQRTRLGIIIRAGVQDSEMVEALGINVRRVFTQVFALGTGLAALGGVVATPFLGVNPGLAAEFVLQAFIVVVIGGMGSFPGAIVGALILGLARAFGDQFVLSGITLPGMAEAVKFSPAIARASTVLIMAIVLLVRPAGIFGKRS